MNIDVLAHNQLRDVEAEVIQVLFERVKALEKRVEQLDTNSSLSPVLVSGEIDNGKCNTDSLIEDFLDGSGI